MTIDTNYDVGNKTIKIHDKINNINFDTWLLYPSSDKSNKTKLKPNDMDPALNSKMVTGKFPIVLISHGGGGSHLLYKIVAKYLAENGYIVAMIEHHGNGHIFFALLAKFRPVVCDLCPQIEFSFTDEYVRTN